MRETNSRGEYVQTAIQTEKLISDRTYKASQSWHREQIKVVSIPGNNLTGPLSEQYKVRLSIERNAYDFQSHARAEVWNPRDLKWNQVATIPYAEMASCAPRPYSQHNVPEICYTQDALSFHGRQLMQEDLDELDRLVEGVLA